MILYTYYVLSFLNFRAISDEHVSFLPIFLVLEPSQPRIKFCNSNLHFIFIIKIRGINNVNIWNSREEQYTRFLQKDGGHPVYHLFHAIVKVYLYVSHFLDIIFIFDELLPLFYPKQTKKGLSHQHWPAAQHQRLFIKRQ